MCFHSYILSLFTSLVLAACLLLLLILSLLPPSLSLALSPPHSPPTVWTAAVSPQPPVFLSVASAGEGSPSGKKLSSPPQRPPTLPVWLTPESGTPAHTHTRERAQRNEMQSVAMREVDLHEGQHSRDNRSGGGGVTHIGTR